MGLMVFLDVVYNHFGPKGITSASTRRSSSPTAQEPVGAAIDFAVDPCASLHPHTRSIAGGIPLAAGASTPARHHRRVAAPYLDDIAAAVHRARSDGIASVLERRNQARFLGPASTTAWTTIAPRLPRARDRQSDGYYVSYVERLEASCALPRRRLRLPGRGLAFQQGGARRAERHCGRLLRRLHAEPRPVGTAHTASASHRSPTRASSRCCRRSCFSPRPRCFHGQEWGCHQPFLFFCDFEGELGARCATAGATIRALRRVRRRQARARIPDPLSSRPSSAACCAGRRAQRRGAHGSRTTRSCSSCAGTRSRSASSARAATGC